jgi:hypothetical protein
MQLASFLTVFIVLTGMYISVILFSDPGSKLVGDLMSAGGIAI